MADVTIDASNFCKRLKKLFEAWREEERNQSERQGWAGAESLLIYTGARSDVLRYLKSIAVQLWLFGYELPDTIMFFIKDKQQLHVLGSATKAGLLAPLVEAALKEAGVAMHIHKLAKGDEGASQIRNFLKEHAGGNAPLGTLLREKHDGKVAAEVSQALADAAAAGQAQVDVSLGLSELLAVKDAGEVLNVKKAAMLASKVVKDWVVPQLEEILDKGKRMRHSKLSEMAEEVIAEPARVHVKLKPENCDIAYQPLFQSGGTYDLRFSAVSDDQPLAQEGVVIISLGARYSSYCANISRTFLVNGTKRQEGQYKALLAAQEAAIQALRPGAPLSAPMEAAAEALRKAGQEELVPHLGRNVGYGIGLELREGALQLRVAAEDQPPPAPIHAGMVFNVCVGLTGLEEPEAKDPKLRRYNLQLADTVIVAQDPAKPPEVATAFMAKAWTEVSYALNEDDEDGASGDEGAGREAGVAGRAKAGAADLGAGGRKALRSDNNGTSMQKTAEQIRKEQQEALLTAKNEETLRRLTAQAQGGTADAAGGAGSRKISEIEVYRGVQEVQVATRDPVIQLDNKAEAVLLPLYGVLVPFHVSVVKNVSVASDAADSAVIRITFQQGPTYEPFNRFPNCVFLKELSFRSHDVKHANRVVLDLRLLRSTVQQRDRERAERATLVAQEKLIRGKRVFKLPDVWMRPAFPGRGKKVPGHLEAHQNGFRYTTPRNETLDVMYRNVKHAFFQPAQNEMVTLVHLHLVHPIMVANKKTRDVQFYTEVMDVVATLDGSRRSMYDPDEVEEEQRERERRNRINREFQNFVQRVQEVWEREFPDLGLEFDVPYRELGFAGSHHNNTVRILPTNHCLVELIEMPFLVISLNDIEIVALERALLHLKNFDMAVVPKEFSREVVKIDSIPSTSLEAIEDWLNSVKIKYYETQTALNWRQILKTVQEDPEAFVQQGGWNFLDAEASSSDEGERGEGEHSEEDYAPSGASEEEEEEEDSEDDSEAAADASLDEEESDDEEEDEDEDEGMDWDEMEEEARRADKEQRFSDTDEEDRRQAKRKAGAAAGGSTSVKRRR